MTMPDTKEGTPEQRLIRWLHGSCNYWMDRANAGDLDDHDEATDEVRRAFDGDPGVMAAWEAAWSAEDGINDRPARIDITLWPRTGGVRVHEHRQSDGSDEPKEWS